MLLTKDRDSIRLACELVDNDELLASWYYLGEAYLTPFNLHTLPIIVELEEYFCEKDRGRYLNLTLPHMVEVIKKYYNEYME